MDTYKKKAVPKAIREQLWIQKVGRKFETKCKSKKAFFMVKKTRISKFSRLVHSVQQLSRDSRQVQIK
jgi:hypothetical protein